jgi:RNA polymerase sigma-70 factor (ECF subfamily)
MNTDSLLLAELKRGSRDAFSFLFRKYYKDLILFGGTFLLDRNYCEDIVQNIFVRLWENRENITIEESLKSFLLKAVQNACIDELRHRQSVSEYEKYIETFSDYDSMDTENYILYSDMHAQLDNALKRLPEACRQAFVMNRFEGLKYKEIARQLNVSERTVEVRIGKAIGLLRLYLKDFLPVVFAVLCHINNI